jgi:beta-lactamase superfamily II metal-dependent hydrolase
VYARVVIALAALAALAGCPAKGSTLPPARPTSHGPPPAQITPEPGEPRVTWDKVNSPEDVSATPPPPGTYRVHMIDVGTGLALLVQGHDWTRLYDGGSGDPGEKPMRVVS